MSHVVPASCILRTDACALSGVQAQAQECQIQESRGQIRSVPHTLGTQ